MTTYLQYEEIHPISRADAEAAFASGDGRKINLALIGLGLYDPDWEWVQTRAARFFSNADEIVVCGAILCVAHSARLAGRAETTTVLPALLELHADPRYTGRVQDALDDIGIFTTAFDSPP